MTESMRDTALRAVFCSSFSHIDFHFGHSCSIIHPCPTLHFLRVRRAQLAPAFAHLIPHINPHCSFCTLCCQPASCPPCPPPRLYPTSSTGRSRIEYISAHHTNRLKLPSISDHALIAGRGTNSIMSLRRSARAPTTQPAATTQQQNKSSSSSVSSGRVDRNARAHQKLPSPRSSVAANSRSSEEQDDSAKAPPRRTRSSNDEARNDVSAAMIDDHDENEEEETRCICGQLEYPGLPVTSSDSRKDKTQDDSNAVSGEDNTGWFIQCDSCQIWQHGGCVGILDESQSPEKYFCEQCRKDLHKILIDVNGYV